MNSFNIESYIANEYMANIKPSLLSAGGLNTVSLQVGEEDFENARKIIEDYNKGIFSLNPNQ